MRYLVGFGCVFVVAASFFGCESDNGGTGTDGAARVGVLGMPLSAACSSCAQQAIVTTCSAELDACVKNPSCLDVDACFQSCAANDAACFGKCAQASAQFAALVDCVLCDSCAKDCSGDWSCQGQPPPPPPGPTTCLQCLGSDTSGSICSEIVQKCEATTDCAATLDCAEKCGNDQTCIQQCVGQSATSSTLLAELQNCGDCGGCADACKGVLACSSTPPPPPTDACATCIASATKQTCAQQVDACAAVQDCGAALECTLQCTDLACVDKCATLAQTAEGQTDYKNAVTCLSAACGADCQP